MKILFLDLETTGTNHWQHGIHQISGCIDIDGETKKSFNFKVRPNPAAKIAYEALDIGKVSIEVIQQYPPMIDVYKQIIEMLSEYVDKFNKSDKFFICGYNNASFDDKMFRAFFVQNGDAYFGSWFWSNSIDVMVLATNHSLTIRNTMIDFKLKTVASHFGITIDPEKLHDAEYDIYLTRSLYYILQNRKDPITEKEIISQLSEMAMESLAPEILDKWEEVKHFLQLSRKNLKD